MIRFQLLFVALALLSSPLTSYAQPEDPAKVALARELFTGGVEAVKNNKWELALSNFERSYQLAPRIGTLLNLAGAQFETARYLEASRSFKKFLREASAEKHREKRKNAEAQLALISTRLAKVRFEITNLKPDDIVTIDGDSRANSAINTHMPLNPGIHTIVVRSGQTELARNQFSLISQERKTVRVFLPERNTTTKREKKFTEVAPDKSEPAPVAKRSNRLVVVINAKAKVSQLSRSAIRSIFLGKRKFWQSGKSIVVFSRSSRSKLGKEFLANVVRMRPNEFKLHWDELQLSGRGLKPRSISSGAKIIQLVRTNAGGVGFISEAELPANTRGLTIIRL